MEVQFALVCDNANLSDTGKLNILGEFDNISSASFPCTHLMMFYVAKVLFSANDPEQMLFELRIVSEDGELATQPLRLAGRRRPLPANGELVESRMVIQVVGAEFKAPGLYSFELHSGGLQLHVVNLKLLQVGPP